MNHQDLAPVDERDALLLRETPQALRHEVTDGGSRIGEESGLAPLLIVDRNEALWVHRGERQVGRAVRADGTECLEALPDFQGLWTSEQ